MISAHRGDHGRTSVRRALGWLSLIACWPGIPCPPEASARDLAVVPSDLTLLGGLDGSQAVAPRATAPGGTNGARSTCLGATCWSPASDVGGGWDLATLTPDFASVGAVVKSGDVDGDGTEDLVVGMPDGATLLGGVVVFLGPRRPPELAPSRLGPEVGDWRLLGTGETGLLGLDVLLADFDGDGNLDIVAVGEPEAMMGTSVVLGVRGPVTPGATLDLTTEDPTFAIWGAAPFGGGIALGDFDGDGLDDLAIAFDTGVRLYLGPALAGDVNADAPDVELPYPVSGSGQPDSLDTPVALRDVDGDGRADLIVGLPGGDGEVNLVFGRASPAPLIPLGADPANLVVRGAGTEASLGASVAVGDWNGDDVGDLLAGSPGSGGPDGTRTSAGAVHLLLGPLLPGVRDLAANPADVTFHGPESSDRLGAGFMGSGSLFTDVNEDGADDVLAWARGDAGAGNAASTPRGAVHVIHAPRRSPFDLWHATGDPSALSVLDPTVTSPWDSPSGWSSDGALHFFRVVALGGGATIGVTRLRSSDGLRVGWRDGAADPGLVDASLSTVHVSAPCAHPDGHSALVVTVTPRDGSGERLGSGLEVVPIDIDASWAPALPSGGFRDLRDGRYQVEVAVAEAGTGLARVTVDGVLIATEPAMTFTPSSPRVEAIDRSAASVGVGQLVTLTAIVSGGTPPLVTSWDVDGDHQLDLRGPSVAVAWPTTGLHGATVVVRDASGCVARQTTRIRVE